VEVAQKPTFYSDSDFFIVTLPNRSVATPAQISMESVASGAESAETSAETSTVLHRMSTDAEVSELCKRLDNTRLTASTKERTLELFKRYRYQYQFRSINVAQLYGVQKSRASSIIKNLIKHGLVTSPEYGVYQFVKK
jgi:ATP-dependent DNA helicase RecG